MSRKTEFLNLDLVFLDKKGLFWDSTWHTIGFP